MKLHHIEKFRNYTKMDPGTFDDLLSKAEPTISMRRGDLQDEYTFNLSCESAQS